MSEPEKGHHMKRSAALIILFIAALTISVPMSGTAAAWATGPRVHCC
jgi:hypothetical protein